MTISDKKESSMDHDYGEKDVEPQTRDSFQSELLRAVRKRRSRLTGFDDDDLASVPEFDAKKNLQLSKFMAKGPQVPRRRKSSQTRYNRPTSLITDSDKWVPSINLDDSDDDEFLDDDFDSEDGEDGPGLSPNSLFSNCPNRKQVVDRSGSSIRRSVSDVGSNRGRNFQVPSRNNQLDKENLPTEDSYSNFLNHISSVDNSFLSNPFGDTDLDVKPKKTKLEQADYYCIDDNENSAQMYSEDQKKMTVHNNLYSSKEPESLGEKSENTREKESHRQRHKLTGESQFNAEGDKTPVSNDVKADLPQGDNYLTAQRRPVPAPRRRKVGEVNPTDIKVPTSKKDTEKDQVKRSSLKTSRTTESAEKSERRSVVDFDLSSSESDNDDWSPKNKATPLSSVSTIENTKLIPGEDNKINKDRSRIIFKRDSKEEKTDAKGKAFYSPDVFYTPENSTNIGSGEASKRKTSKEKIANTVKNKTTRSRSRTSSVTSPRDTVLSSSKSANEVSPVINGSEQKVDDIFEAESRVSFSNEQSSKSSPQKQQLTSRSENKTAKGPQLKGTNITKKSSVSSISSIQGVKPKQSTKDLDDTAKQLAGNPRHKTPLSGIGPGTLRPKSARKTSEMVDRKGPTKAVQPSAPIQEKKNSKSTPPMSRKISATGTSVTKTSTKASPRTGGNLFFTAGEKDGGSLFFTGGTKTLASPRNIKTPTSPRETNIQRKNSTPVGRKVSKVKDAQQKPSSTYNNISNLQPAATKTNVEENRTFSSAKGIRDQVYQEWLTNKTVVNKQKTKVERETSKQKEAEKAELEKNKKYETGRAFQLWEENKIEAQKETQKKRRAQEKAKKEKAEEEIQRKLDTKKYFEDWKASKDEKLKDQHRKSRIEEKTTVKQTSRDKKQKEEDAKKTFEIWKAKKEEELKEQKIKTLKKEKEDKNREKLEAQKKIKAEETFEKWKETKPARTRSRSTSLVQRPWCPSGRMTGNAIPERVQPVIQPGAPNRAKSASLARKPRSMSSS